MNQPAINFSPPPEPGKLKFDHGSQNRIIYELLYRGGADAVEITKASGSMTHSRRISDIREALKPHGFTVMSRRLEGKRVYFYWIVATKDLPEILNGGRKDD